MQIYATKKGVRVPPNGITFKNRSSLKSYIKALTEVMDFRFPTNFQITGWPVQDGVALKKYEFTLYAATQVKLAKKVNEVLKDGMPHKWDGVREVAIAEPAQNKLVD